MILFIGNITEENEKAINIFHSLVIIEPTKNKSLFEVNGILNELHEFIDTNIVLWTNHPMLLETLCHNEGVEIFHVEDGRIYKADISELKNRYQGIDIIELITRNWHFEDLDYIDPNKDPDKEI